MCLLSIILFGNKFAVTLNWFQNKPVCETRVTIFYDHGGQCGDDLPNYECGSNHLTHF